METAEAQIIRRCQAGEFDCFGELYDAYVKKIYSFIYYRTHHKETAEDIASLVFVKALEGIKSFNPKKGSFASWLYQIARNAVIDHYRSFKATEDIENAWDLPSASNVERDVSAIMQLEKVKGYLRELSALQKDIVLMRVWDGLSHKEIAEILGISEANCKMSFSRAMARINKETAVAMMLVLIAIKG